MREVETRGRIGLLLSYPGATFSAMTSKPEWELSDFRRVHLDTNNIEILMHANGSTALVVWPWWVDPSDISEATWTAEMMGFEDITEVGNMTGYSIPEIECEDWDFMVLSVMT